MIRADREVKDRDEILDIIRRCDVVRLAIHDEPFPYVVPVNFGFREEEGDIVLYLHGAKVGKTMELLARNPNVGFEMDCGHEMDDKPEIGECSMDYESIIGAGTIEFLPEEAKLEALELLLAHYHEDAFPFNHRMIPATNVMRLRVVRCTGKRRKMHMPAASVTGTPHQKEE